MTKKNVYYLVNPIITAADEEERFPEFYRSKVRSAADFTALNTNNGTILSYPEEEK